CRTVPTGYAGSGLRRTGRVKGNRGNDTRGHDGVDAIRWLAATELVDAVDRCAFARRSRRGNRRTGAGEAGLSGSLCALAIARSRRLSQRAAYRDRRDGLAVARAGR